MAEITTTGDNRVVVSVGGVTTVLDNTDSVRLVLAALQLSVGGDFKDLLTSVDGPKRVRLATTGNIADLATGAPDTVDGQSVAVDDRIMVPFQTNLAENGVYVVTTVGTGSDGVWARASDHDHASDFIPGQPIYVEEGDSNGTTTFQQTTTGTITVDTTDVDYVQGGPLVRSDAAPVSVALDSATINQTDNFTAAIDCRDFPWVNLLITWTGGTSSPSELHAKWQWSMDGSTWVDATTEAITTGSAPQSPYDAYHSDISTTGSSRGFGVPTTGKRYWRANVTVDAGTLTTASADYQRGAA